MSDMSKRDVTGEIVQAAHDAVHMFALRPDGREEVADTTEANALYGCQLDDWCILRNGHTSHCNEFRDIL
jgi:hypothetical protein